MKLTSLTRTCYACPSQWEGTTDDGQEVYIRYRWGFLAVYLGGVMGIEVYGEQIGDDLDGLMESATMLEHTGLTFDGLVAEEA